MPVAAGERGGWLPREAQLHVNKAIDRGVEFLKEKQNPAGLWGEQRRVGMAALPALTLLECGVPATDPRVQKAAALVRSRVDIHTTYDLALTILFLDKLKDPQDKKQIQTCTLRLVAGQQASGGWSYSCPPLSPEQEKQLLTALTVTRPRAPLDLFLTDKNGKPPEWFVPVKMQPAPELDGKTSQRPGSGRTSVPGSTIPLEGDKEAKPPPANPPTPEQVRKTINQLPAPMRTIPALVPIKQAHVLPAFDITDNSNTQFAILGLWAATRHDVPVERALALIVLRFRNSQNADGSWAYIYHKGGMNLGTPSMTGAGLLGLAVGHGLAVGQGKVADDHKAEFKDRAIERGFTALSHEIGKPFGIGANFARPRFNAQINFRQLSPINLYFLWTVERVGVLYNQRQFGGKEWYAWGVEELLNRQRDDGAWENGGYHGANEIVDTCFALLFLRRANLAADLATRLEFVIQDRPR
jgi:hypothetical protein